MTLRNLIGRKMIWKVVVGGNDTVTENGEVEPRYCSVCEAVLPLDGRLFLEHVPSGEVIEVCAACFDTRPEDYKPLME